MILRAFLVVLVLVAAALLPGALAVSLWGKRFRADPLEFLFAALALGVLMIGWPALLLAELGFLSIIALSVFWMIVVLSLGYRLWRVRRRSPTPSTAWQINRWEVVALG